MKSYKALEVALLSLGVLQSPLLLADEPAATAENNSEKIVVTANRMETPVDQVATSVTIIDQDDIKKRGKDQVYEILRNLPGITVNNQGGIGRKTSVFVRGTDGDKVLVLIDGIKMNDPLSPNRDFNFGTLSLDNIERIEVVRGAQSVLYGSDAIGGVINIITKKGSKSQPTRLGAEVEYGTYKTYQARGNAIGSQNGLNYSLSAELKSSDGYSAADNALGNTETDSYSLKTVSGKFNAQPAEALDMTLTARYSHSLFDMDTYGGANGDDPNSKSEEKRFYSRLEAKGRGLQSWEPKVAVSYALEKREDKNDADTANPSPSHGNYNGTRIQAEAQNMFVLNEANTLHLGVEGEREQGDFSEEYFNTPYSFDTRGTNIFGAFAQHKYLSSSLFSSTGIRYDKHQVSGSRVTYRLAPGYRIEATGTTFKGSLGTGFKTPSLYQLYSSYGSTNLKAETSLTYDLGIEQKLGGEALVVSATYFNNQLENLIGSGPGFVYYNINKAKTEGLEFSAHSKLGGAWSGKLIYTYLRTKDETTGLELLRRPRHQASVQANYDFSESGSATLYWRFTGTRQDLDVTDTINYTAKKTMSPFSVLDLSASTKLGGNFQVFGRVENILDTKYQEIDGYGTAGRSFFVGLRTEI
jgi:vitamin B12 transporter